jgi:hypothetical protein
MTAGHPDRTAEALSALLVDHAELLLPLASRLGEGQPDFESAVRGNSMAPAIPAGARIRVRPGEGSACRIGDVVFYLSDGGYVVHRVVYRPGPPADGDYLLTEGDARFAPDPPVPCRQVLGTVVAVQGNGQWAPVGRPVPGPWHRRVVRAVTLPVMILATKVSLVGAQRLARALLAVEFRARLARRWLIRVGRRARFEAVLALGPARNLLDRARHPDVTYERIDVPAFNARFPKSRRLEVARAISECLAESDNAVYFRNVSWYNWSHRHLPRGIPSLEDLYPPNVAVLDFISRRITDSEREVLLDFPCGIGALLVYARDLGLARIHGFDSWTYLASATATRFLGRFGMDRSVLVGRDDLATLPVTILTCIGFPLAMLMETSSVWTKPSVRYVLTDRMSRPMVLPGFRRTTEYAGLLTVFERVFSKGQHLPSPVAVILT